MRTKKEIELELTNIKRQMEELTAKSVDTSKLMQEVESSDKTSEQMFTLLRYMIDENKRTTTLLVSMSTALARLEEELLQARNQGESEKRVSETAKYQQKPQKELPISGIDAKLIQNIQLSGAGMACADDLKEKMNYRGRNAVSARLNKLHNMGILERYQIGKRVYYKYDAGKRTDILIVSPSQ